MRVVVVDADVSYPPSSGKRLRTLHLMLRLARRHRLTYIARSHLGPTEIRAARAFLGDHGIEPVLLHDPLPRKAGPAFYARLAWNLLSPLPYSVASHQSRRMAEALAGHAARHAVDLWQVEWSPYVAALPAPLSPPVPGGDKGAGRRLLVAHNVDSLIWQRYHETERHPLKRFYVRRQWRKFERFERRVLPAVDRVVAVSREDAELMRRQFGVTRVDVVENGIDRAFFEGVDDGRSADSRTILFLGSLEWRPNLDAVRLLLDDIFPAVRRAEPSARLCVVGRNAPDWLARRVAATANAELHSDVADVRPFLARSDVLAVPLRIGGGSRLKILEALACGVPVVSTRVGAEGLELRPGHDLSVVETAAEMAGELVAVLREPERARAMARQARASVLERYDWDVLAGKLEAAWEKCVGGSKGRCEGEPCASCI